MKCPVCDGDIIVLQESCPHCQADLSLVMLLKDAQNRLALEAEEELTADIFNENARAKAAAIRLLRGRAEKVEALLNKKPTAKQIFVHCWKRHGVTGVISVMGLWILILTGVIIGQYRQAADVDSVKLPVPFNPILQHDGEVREDNIVMENSSDVNYIIVRKGDSFWKISRDLNRSDQFMEKLALENAMTIEEPLYPGQRLKVPLD